MVLYYLCSKNNSEDQPCGNCAADLCLGFYIKSRFSHDKIFYGCTAQVVMDWLAILKAGFLMTQLMIPVFYSRLDNESP